MTQSGTTGTVTGEHTYATDEVYTVTLSVSNAGGQTGQATFQYVVVYNPSAGFVTGGGWINSPAGAFAANPALTGPANFGFNARYHSGDTVPTGSTQFQFPAANLTFQSTGYDWLVITTNQGQYQGSGAINGAGNYGFLVTARDNGAGSTPDKLRLKIWDRGTGAVVYDTQPGAPTTAAPTTALGGGRLQVHTNTQLAAGGGTPGGDAAPLTPAELQPVVQEAIARWQAAGIDEQQVRTLRQVTVGIAAFPGPWLGMAFPGAIWIDQNAAGYGWYIDATPAGNAAFPAGPASAAFGKIDLLTVVAHELGHQLGFEDNDGAGLMGIMLPTGTQRLPSLEHEAGLAAAPAQGAMVVAANADLADPGSGILPPGLRPAALGFNLTAGAGLSAEPASSGWPALFALGMESPDVPLPVLSQPRFLPAAGEDNSLSRPVHTALWGSDAEVLDRVFAGTSVSWLGEPLGNDLALDYVG